MTIEYAYYTKNEDVTLQLLKHYKENRTFLICSSGISNNMDKSKCIMFQSNALYYQKNRIDFVTNLLWIPYKTWKW